MARKAEFGPKIYEIVEREHAEKGTPKSDIFKKIAADRGAYGLEKMTGKHGSVAASYYREFRKHNDESQEHPKNGKRISASPVEAAVVPPLNPVRPGVRVDGAASTALAQELTAQIEGAIRSAVETAVAPLIAERDEAVKRLTQIQAALGH